LFKDVFGLFPTLGFLRCKGLTALVRTKKLGTFKIVVFLLEALSTSLRFNDYNIHFIWRIALLEPIIIFISFVFTAVLVLFQMFGKLDNTDHKRMN
ncbi:hypothetical protein ACJX0J_006931, partial [Zea mays]